MPGASFKFSRIWMQALDTWASKEQPQRQANGKGTSGLLKVLLLPLWVHSSAFGFTPTALQRGFRELAGVQQSARTAQSRMLQVTGMLARHRKTRWQRMFGAVQKAAKHKRVRSSVALANRSEADSTEFVEQFRFHLTPGPDWVKSVVAMECNATNTMNWTGEIPLPQAPTDCWLLPTKEDAAEAIGRLQGELREAGWKVLTCDPDIIAALGDKSRFRGLAEKLGKLHLLPRHWTSPEEASYPCILKAAQGEYGQGTHIVNSVEEVHNIAGENLGSNWVLQELVKGGLEYSTSLLVVEGQIADAITTEYEYDGTSYVWPNIGELERNSFTYIPHEHLADMSAFLRGFSGICNFNYKIRWDVNNFVSSTWPFGGQMCIFEVNPRVGADLGCDIPRDRARVLFERLDELTEWAMNGRFWQQMPPSLLNHMMRFNSNVAVHKKGCSWQKASGAQQSGTKPDIFDYLSAIMACKRSGQWEQTVSLLDKMHEEGVTPHVVGYSTAIAACEKGGLWEPAMLLLDKMRKVSLTPDQICFGAAIAVCEKGGHWEQALHLLNKIREERMIPSAMSIFAAMDACEKSGESERATLLFEDMYKPMYQRPWMRRLARPHARPRAGARARARARAAARLRISSVRTARTRARGRRFRK